MAVLEFSVAVNERRKNGQGEWDDYASFIECTMFGKRAEGVLPYLAKGTHVGVQGRIRQDRWEKDGQTRSKVKVLVDEIDFSGSKRQEQQQPVQGSLYDDDCPF